MKNKINPAFAIVLKSFTEDNSLFKICSSFWEKENCLPKSKDSFLLGNCLPKIKGFFFWETYTFLFFKKEKGSAGVV
ncbi:MAG: hypothetical protein PHH08_03795 [Candidatus ainarchaeum sp.]|nr:hypothetical protein [Candidatus ainarchaeum sp.]